MIAARLSFIRRRAAAPFAFKAVRYATPYSQAPTSPRDRIDAALRTKTRKAA